MIIENIVAMLEREVRSVQDHLLSGMCPDYVVYREEVARLTTLMKAIEIVQNSSHEEEEEE